MARVLLATGFFSWDAIERRSDRYGSVRLNGDDEDENILVDERYLALEGTKGKLYAEVIRPVKSQHMGDLARGIRPSMPNKGELVFLGVGELFIDQRGRAVHENGELENNDKKLQDETVNAMTEAFSAMGFKITADPNGRAGEPPIEKEPPYDLIGLKPDDNRKSDWLDPNAFYRLHMSKINLYFDDDPEADMLPTEKTAQEIKDEEEAEKFKQKAWKRITLRQRGTTNLFDLKFESDDDVSTTPNPLTFVRKEKIDKLHPELQMKVIESAVEYFKQEYKCDVVTFFDLQGRVTKIVHPFGEKPWVKTRKVKSNG